MTQKRSTMKSVKQLQLPHVKDETPVKLKRFNRPPTVLQIKTRKYNSVIFRLSGIKGQAQQLRSEVRTILGEHIFPVSKQVDDRLEFLISDIDYLIYKITKLSETHRDTLKKEMEAEQHKLPL